MPASSTLGDVFAQGAELADQGLTPKEIYDRLVEQWTPPSREDELRALEHEHGIPRETIEAYIANSQVVDAPPRLVRPVRPIRRAIVRTFARRRPQGRAPRRATVRRPSRAGSRAAPSDSASDPPPRRRLLRILDRIIAGWLGLAAFERRLAELDRETTRRLRGGA